MVGNYFGNPVIWDLSVCDTCYWCSLCVARSGPAGACCDCCVGVVASSCRGGTQGHTAMEGAGCKQNTQALIKRFLQYLIVCKAVLIQTIAWCWWGDQTFFKARLIISNPGVPRGQCVKVLSVLQQVNVAVCQWARWAQASTVCLWARWAQASTVCLWARWAQASTVCLWARWAQASTVCLWARWAHASTVCLWARWAQASTVCLWARWAQASPVGQCCNVFVGLQGVSRMEATGRQSPSWWQSSSSGATHSWHIVSYQITSPTPKMRPHQPNCVVDSKKYSA